MFAPGDFFLTYGALFHEKVNATLHKSATKEWEGEGAVLHRLPCRTNTAKLALVQTVDSTNKLFLKPPRNQFCTELNISPVTNRVHHSDHVIRTFL